MRCCLLRHYSHHAGDAATPADVRVCLGSRLRAEIAWDVVAAAMVRPEAVPFGVCACDAMGRNTTLRSMPPQEDHRVGTVALLRLTTGVEVTGSDTGGSRDVALLDGALRGLLGAASTAVPDALADSNAAHRSPAFRASRASAYYCHYR